MPAFQPFEGFELHNSHTPPLRLAAANVARDLYLVIDDDARCEPRRWRLTQKGAAMFSATNIALLVYLGYAVEET